MAVSGSYALLDTSLLDTTLTCNGGTRSEIQWFRIEIRPTGATSWIEYGYGYLQYYGPGGYWDEYISSVSNNDLDRDFVIGRSPSGLIYPNTTISYTLTANLGDLYAPGSSCGHAGVCGDIQLIQVDVNGNDVPGGVTSTLKQIGCSIREAVDGFTVELATTTEITGTVTTGPLYYGDGSTTPDNVIPDDTCILPADMKDSPIGVKGYADFKISGTGTLTIDGITPTVNQLILLKNQTTQEHNGVYQVGINDGSNWEINRYDVNQLIRQGFGFWVDVTSGNTNAGKSFVVDSDPPLMFTLTPLQFIETDINNTSLSDLIIDTGNYQCSSSSVSTKILIDRLNQSQSSCARGLLWKNEWATGTQYFTVDQTDGDPCNSDIVGHNGIAYICIQSHTSDSMTEPGIGTNWASYWEVFSSTGPAGQDGDCGRGWNHTGDWVNGNTYEIYDPSVGVCTDDVVQHNGSTYVAILDHVADSTNEPGVGAQWQTYWNVVAEAGQGGSPVTDWTDGKYYNAGDMVQLDGCTYVADVDHLADDTTKPDFHLDGGFYWTLISCGNSEDKGLFDNLVGGLFDWLKDIGNWGIGDWLTALAAGAGLIWAGTKLVEMFTADPIGDGNADTRFTGTPCTSTYTPVTLPQAISLICDYAQITNYDVSLLPATEVNFTIGQITSGRSILEMLSQVYFFDMIDSGGTLKFVPRGDQSVVKTLSSDYDLGWSTTGTPSPPYNTKRLQGVDLPKSVSLTYFSEASAHNEMVQTSTLETYTEGADVYLQVPVTLTEDEAMKVTELTMINSHVERTTYSFTTPWWNLDLEPGDVVEVADLGAVRILRIDENAEEGLLDFVVVDAGVDVNSYTPSTIPAQPPVTYTDSPTAIGYSAGLIIELPPFNETHKDNPRLSIAPHGYGAENWPGCAIYVSVDGGTTYSYWDTANKEATWGRVANAISPPPSTAPWLWDDVTTFTVELKTGELQSVTKQDVYLGENWCVVGEEVIGFTTATLISGKTYEISGLLRGRKGTEVKMDSHVNDEAFVLLDDAIMTYPYDVNAKQQVLNFKFVTAGSDLSKATAYPAQANTVSLRPWKLSDVTVTDSNSDKVIQWTGRNQFDGELIDGTSTLNPTGFGGYVINFLDVSNNIVRTVTTQQNSYTYTLQQQNADGNVATHIEISQVDLRVGPGYHTTINL